ncbi:MAG: transglycosylase domain-containing protein, partial [Polyangiales bacterium]
GRVLRRLRRRFDRARGSVAVAGGRSYRLRGGVLRLDDAAGGLVHCDGLALARPAAQVDRLQLRAARCQLGSRRDSQLTWMRSQAQLGRAAGRWQLRQVRTAMLQLRVGTGLRPAGALRALLRRLRRAWQPMHPFAVGVSVAPPGGTKAAWGRPSAPWDVVLRALSPDFRLSVDRLHWHSEHLRGLAGRLQLRRTAAWRFRLQGRGRGRGGMRLGWDFALRPLPWQLAGRLSFGTLPLALVQPLLPALPFATPERTTLSGQLRIERADLGTMPFHLRFAAHNLAFASAKLAPEPLRALQVEMVLKGRYHSLARRLAVEAGLLQLGRVRVQLRGQWWRRPGAVVLDAALALPPTPCQHLVDAVPAAFWQQARDFALSGQLAGSAHIALDTRQPDDVQLKLAVDDGCQFVASPAAATVARLSAPFLHPVEAADGSDRSLQTGPGSALWVPLAAISPFVVQAVLSHEDGGFYAHQGFATWAIRDALAKNLKAGRFAYGASTISMQLAKNLFLQRDKTLVRKAREVLYTWWLERHFDKDALLALYLNIIEYGPGIYGIGAATQHYFGLHPSQLTPAQAAFLACILPAPGRYHSQRERGVLSASIQGHMRRLLLHMHRRGRIDALALGHGLAELDVFRFRGDPARPPQPWLGSAAVVPAATERGAAMGAAPEPNAAQVEAAWENWNRASEVR